MEPSVRKLKLSEASAANGIPTGVLTNMARDGLFPQAIRGRGGHLYFPETAVPTWNECVEILEEERDRRLRRAKELLNRLDREIEAVRNDINEAREHPAESLGVDFLTIGHRSYGLVDSAEGQPAITGILQAFSFERMRIVGLDRTLRDARDSVPDGDGPDL